MYSFTTALKTYITKYLILTLPHFLHGEFFLVGVLLKYEITLGHVRPVKLAPLGAKALLSQVLDSKERKQNLIHKG